MSANPKPIVLAIDSHMQCHAYGPFLSEQEAELWRKAQDDNPRNADWQYVVIPLAPASVRVSRPQLS